MSYITKKEPQAQKKEFFEILYLIPAALGVFNAVQELLNSIRPRFSSDDLSEVEVYAWTLENRVGILLRFNYKTFIPSKLKFFEPWIERLGIEVIELEKFSREEKAAIREKVAATSEFQIVGTGDIDQELRRIRSGLVKLHEQRNNPRAPARVKIRFKSIPAFIREYTENISSGGMFIRGRTDLPLRSRFEVVMKLPDSFGEVEALAEVVRVVADGPVPGSGIQFVRFYQDGKRKMENCLWMLTPEESFCSSGDGFQAA